MKAQKFLSLFLLIGIFFIVSCKGNNFEKALAYQTDGEYEKAIDYYGRAINKNDNAAEAEKKCSICCTSLKKVDRFEDVGPNYFELAPYYGTRNIYICSVCTSCQNYC